jgi:hypothetical protein
MPRLHKYVSRNAHYILTSINGSVITYQLTPAGERKLASAGVVAGENFERAMLLDLYRTGDAFAPGVEFAEAVIANQLEMDFAGDPSPESAFPLCDGCGSATDLHLTLAGHVDGLTARLHCAACRATFAEGVDTSVPLGLLTRSLVTRLLEMKSVSSTSTNVRKYEALLDAALVLRWDGMRKERVVSQSLLFSDGDLGGLGLGS